MPLNTMAPSSHSSSPKPKPFIPLICASAQFLDDHNMGRSQDWAEAPQISCILTREKQALRTAAMINFSSSSQQMNEDFARIHGLPCYPMHTLDTVFAINSCPANSLTHYTVAYINISSHWGKVMFHLMKTKPQLKIVPGARWLLQHGVTLNFEQQALIFLSSYCKKHCHPQTKHLPMCVKFLPQGTPTTTTAAVADIPQWTSKLEPDLKTLVLKNYHNIFNVFEKPKPLVLPPWHYVDHTINLGPGTKPLF